MLNRSPIRIDLSQLELPWRALEGDSSGLVAELQSEVTLGHVLFEKNEIRAVAKRDDCDDVLFVLNEVLAVVHLTWAGREDNPQWPGTTLFSSWGEFLSGRMRQDVVEFAEEDD